MLTQIKKLTLQILTANNRQRCICYMTSGRHLPPTSTPQRFFSNLKDNLELR